MNWQKTLERYRNNPVAFVKEALKAKPVQWQAEALKAFAEHDRIAIRSGHGVGKTSLIAWLAIYFLFTRYPAKIGCIAPSASQMENALWPEIKIWARRLPPGLRELIEVTADKVTLVPAPESFAAKRVARKEQPEALQGLHAKHMLILMDEASGIDEIVFQVGEGAMSTPGAKTVMTGNPTRASGYFFNAFHRARRHWWTKKVPSWEVEKAPYYNPELINYYKDNYGEDSNVFRVRIAAEFPKADDDAVIPLELVEAAVTRDVRPTGAVIWGLDVARFGDDRTALCKRHGNAVLSIQAWRNLDNMQVAGRIYDEWRDIETRPEQILIDSIGYGAGVVDRLREMGLPARGVNVSESPAAADQYMRLRDELWFRAREWFEERDCKIPDDDAFIAELTTVKFHPPTSAGKTKVFSKQEIKKLGMPSPDLAESFLMSLAVRGRPGVWNRPIDYPRGHISNAVV